MSQTDNPRSCSRAGSRSFTVGGGGVLVLVVNRCRQSSGAGRHTRRLPHRARVHSLWASDWRNYILARESPCLAVCRHLPEQQSGRARIRNPPAAAEARSRQAGRHFGAAANTNPPVAIMSSSDTVITARLHAFYKQHAPEMLDNIPKVVHDFKFCIQNGASEEQLIAHLEKKCVARAARSVGRRRRA